MRVAVCTASELKKRLTSSYTPYAFAPWTRKAFFCVKPSSRIPHLIKLRIYWHYFTTLIHPSTNSSLVRIPSWFPSSLAISLIRTFDKEKHLAFDLNIFFLYISHLPWPSGFKSLIETFTIHPNSTLTGSCCWHWHFLNTAHFMKTCYIKLFTLIGWTTNCF